jgi:gas vesicle protein
MTEIRERFELTVAKAGRRRNVLAIIDARERRAIDERGARRDREDSLHNEARSFQELLRQAQEALADRQQELKDSLAEELRDIDENLRRRQEKEKEAHERRMRDLDAANEEELRKLAHQLSTIEFAIKRWRNELQRYLNAHPVEIKYRAGPKPKPGRTGSLSGDTGFSGVVEGPTNFKVGPGITEYIYASGPIGGPGTRETPAPSAGATSAMALQHSIRGGINVGMNGLSSQLLSGIGPMLQDSVGQAIVDSITASILGSL